MAGGGKRGGGDRILESRHLVGLFLGVVLLCGVFFTLGYVMGRTQYGGSVHAESPMRPSAAPPIAPKPARAGTSSAPGSSPTASEWDFYSKKDNDHLEAPAKSPAPAGSSSEPSVAEAPASDVPEVASGPSLAVAKGAGHLPPSRIAKGAILLQVAALQHQSDALAMADLLQQKRFPSFVAAPAAGDSLYRVQVGPYGDEHAADAAKGALDRAGFKAIIKR